MTLLSFVVLLRFPLSTTIFTFVQGFWCYFIKDRNGSLKRFANVFAFRDLNMVHHKGWLTFSGGTGSVITFLKRPYSDG